MADNESPVVVGMPGREAGEPAELVLEEQATQPARPTPTAEELEMMAAMESINASAERLVADHLDAYIRRIGGDATFQGWIGVLHPENVTLDGRLLLPDSAHLRLWKEREGSLGTASTFWQDFARVTGGVARGVAASLTPRSAPPGTTPPPNAEEAAALGGPLDGSDVQSLEAARAEVARLRSLLLSQTAAAAAGTSASASAPVSSSSLLGAGAGAAGGAGGGAAGAAGGGGGRLDALLKLTGFGAAAASAAAEPVAPPAATAAPTHTPTLAEQRAALALCTAPLAPTVSADDAFGELFARQERRGTVAAAPPAAPPAAATAAATAATSSSSAAAAAASVGDLFGTPPGASSSSRPAAVAAAAAAAVAAAVPANPFGDAGDAPAPPPPPPPAAAAACNPFGEAIASVPAVAAAPPANPFGGDVGSRLDSRRQSFVVVDSGGPTEALAGAVSRAAASNPFD